MLEYPYSPTPKHLSSLFMPWKMTAWPKLYPNLCIAPAAMLPCSPARNILPPTFLGGNPDTNDGRYRTRPSIRGHKYRVKRYRQTQLAWKELWLGIRTPARSQDPRSSVSKKFNTVALCVMPWLLHGVLSRDSRVQTQRILNIRQTLSLCPWPSYMRMSTPTTYLAVSNDCTP